MNRLNSIPKVFLLSRHAPGDVDIGPVFLRDLCCMLPCDRICCAHFRELIPQHRSLELTGMQIGRMDAPPESGRPGTKRPEGHWAKRWHSLKRHVFERAIEVLRIPGVVRQAEEFGRGAGAELLWVPLDSPHSIRVAVPVAKALRVPLLVTVWDPPDYKLGQYGVDSHTKRRLLRRFDETLRFASCCAVASEDMRIAYQSKYATRCVAMIRGPARPSLPPRTRDRQPRVIIGYSGSLYALDEWNAFLKTLDDHHWQLDGRPVVVRVLSSAFSQQVSGPVQIEFLGWRSTEETIRWLSETDLVYLPYWFSSRYEEVVNLAFPNKLATYVAARVPVLFHGPRRSSPSRFFERYPVGLACHSLEPDQIWAAVRQLASDQDVRSRALAACDAAYQEELNDEVFRRRFAEFLGIAPSLLESRRPCGS